MTHKTYWVQVISYQCNVSLRQSGQVSRLQWIASPVDTRQNLTVWLWKQLLIETPLLWSTYHIPGQLVTREIFDVFVLCIDDLCKLLSIDHFFINPHVHHRVEPVGCFDIVPDYFGNGGAPGGSKGHERKVNVKLTFRGGKRESDSIQTDPKDPAINPADPDSNAPDRTIN